MDYDVIIIGAGMSGLAAGIRLAHFNKRVCIFEQHSLIGGLNSFYRRHGRNFEVGLHAMTNFVAPNVKNAPLNRLLRQLRLRHQDFDLRQQNYSLIRFPDAELRFSNEIAELEEAVARLFPGQIDGFRRLIQDVQAYDAFSLSSIPKSTKEVLEQYIQDPLLRDMILCPVMFYGNSAENDMDFTQFCIMFQSLFLEGFCRPQGGVRQILNVLLQRFTESGGEIRMNCGVRKLDISDNRVARVELADGTVATAKSVVSSAGYLETMGLCDPLPGETEAHPAGELSFVESIFILDQLPSHFGLDATIIFHNNRPDFHYARPTSLVDERSGVLCIPNNFDLNAAKESEGILRLTHMADYEPWERMDAQEYQDAKDRILESELTYLENFAPDLRRHIVCTDMFTPRTITRFTGHIHGAVYGSPQKLRDGRTAVDNLYLCGTDQGFLGITGALLSGVSIANAYLLK
jgi:phytoene dehydrogenase-like protein